MKKMTRTEVRNLLSDMETAEKAEEILKLYEARNGIDIRPLGILEMAILNVFDQEERLSGIALDLCISRFAHKWEIERAIEDLKARDIIEKGIYNHRVSYCLTEVGKYFREHPGWKELYCQQQLKLSYLMSRDGDDDEKQP